MIISIDTFLRIKIYFKPVTSIQKEDGVTFSTFSKKSWDKNCQKTGLNLWKLVLAVACCDLCQEYSWIVFAFISSVGIFDYTVDGRGV